MVNTENCGQLMKQVSDAIARRANNMLKQMDLTMAQVWILLSLERADGGTCPLKELERSLGVAQSTCAGIVVRLERKGFIECFTDPQDKRVKRVHITASGLACCQKAKQDVLGIENRMFEGLTDEEKSLFYRLLTRIYENIK